MLRELWEFVMAHSRHLIHYAADALALLSTVLSKAAGLRKG